ncbi:MAG: aminotransferase class III-fold pyridoxal phosphate-dependent enzyme, partial [Ilumatobacteraceae bacterium]
MGHTFDTDAAVGHCPFMPVFGPPALMLERGDGTEVFATDGTRYLDFLAGISVVSLGHSHPV